MARDRCPGRPYHVILRMLFHVRHSRGKIIVCSSLVCAYIIRTAFFFFSLCSLSPSFVFVCLFFFTNACSIHSRCPLSRRACLRILRARVLLKRSRNPYIYSRINNSGSTVQKAFFKWTPLPDDTQNARVTTVFSGLFIRFYCYYTTRSEIVFEHTSLKKKNLRTALLRVYVSLEFATRL